MRTRHGLQNSVVPSPIPQEQTNRPEVQDMSAQTSWRYENGEFMAYAWPGGYPMRYLTTDGLFVCAACANEPDTSDPILMAEPYLEGPAQRCEDCGRWMPSAYGIPDGDPAQEDPEYLRFVADAEYRADAWHRGLMASLAIDGARALHPLLRGNVQLSANRTSERRYCEDASDARMESQVQRDYREGRSWYS